MDMKNLGEIKDENSLKQGKSLVGSEYNLGEEDYQRCLVLAEIATFVDAQGVERPKSIFTVAQPGAGKTALKSYILSEAQSNGVFSKFVEFNPDEISTHHKFYPEIIEHYPDAQYDILQRFTRRALDTYLRQRAVEMRCNIMQEGTFASTDGYLSIIDFQQNGGNAQIGEIGQGGMRTTKGVRGDYDVEINVLAVNRFESLLSCFDREQYFDENGLPPRAVTIENHDYAYEKMLQTVDEVEKRKLFNRMRVFRRGYVEEKPELIYIAGDRRFSSASEAIRHERRRQELELFRDPADYLRKLNELKARVERGNNESLKRRLGTLEQIFCAQLEAYRDEKTID